MMTCKCLTTQTMYLVKQCVPELHTNNKNKYIKIYSSITYNTNN